MFSTSKSRQGRISKRTVRAIALGATGAALVAVAGSGCGSSAVITAAPGAPGTTKVIVERVPAPRSAPSGRTPSSPSSPASRTAGAYTSASSCGGDLTAGPNTTCPFAANVRAAYEASGPGTVAVYSPVTHRSYAMTCSSGYSVVCTGGENASVYFASATTGRAYYAPSPSYSVPTVDRYRSTTGATGCGGGVSVGPNTSCAFAQYVRAAYERTGPGIVTAYSPVTHETYAMTCSGDSPVVCSGANNATVYF